MAGLARTLNIARQFSTTALRREGGCVPPGDVRRPSKHVKPPNILVYAEEGKSFLDFKASLISLLEPDRYIIYRLSEQDIVRDAWQESTLLLVLRKPLPPGKGALASLKSYLHDHKGKIWTASSSPWTQRLSEGFGDEAIGLDEGKFIIRDPFEEDPLPSFLFSHFGLSVKSPSTQTSVNNTPSREHLCLYARNPESLNSFLFSKTSLECRIVQDWGSLGTFNAAEYFGALRTRSSLGGICIHGELLSSTSEVVGRGVPHGVIVVADQQTSGTGRGGNEWLSPKGCAMFSLQIHTALKSPLGQRLPMIQHIVGTAVALGLKHLRGPSKVCLKWPNDIYYGSSLKLGGILVSSSICGDSLSVNIGLGLNLNNDRPLPSLNSLLAAERAHNPIRREEFIAETLNALEMLLERVEAGDWDWVLGDYYAHWIHDDQNVKLLNMESKSFECGVIKGLDPFGFLVVETERKGRVTVHPDGNSFDMVKGLILPK